MWSHWTHPCYRYCPSLNWGLTKFIGWLVSWCFFSCWQTAKWDCQPKIGIFSGTTFLVTRTAFASTDFCCCCPSLTNHLPPWTASFPGCSHGSLSHCPIPTSCSCNCFPQAGYCLNTSLWTITLISPCPIQIYRFCTNSLAMTETRKGYFRKAFSKAIASY